MKKNYFFKWLNNLNIKKKLIFSYILVVLLPVLLIGLVLTYSMQKMVTDRAMYEANNSVDRVYARLYGVLKLTQDLYFQFSQDSNLENLVLKQYYSEVEVVDAYTSYSGIINATSSHIMEIQDIKLYTFNKSLLNSDQFVIVEDKEYEAAWFKRARSLNGGICWQMVYSSLKDYNLLSLTAVLKGHIGLKPLGIIVISIHQNYLKSIVNDEPYETIILNDNGIVLAAKNTELIGKKFSGDEYTALSQGTHNIDFGDKSSKAVVKTYSPSVNNKGFRIISIVPVSTITDKVNSTFKLGFIMMMISLVLAAALFSFFSSVISKRVNIMSDDMHTVALGNFNFTPTLEGEDEIGQLSKDLGVMVKSIKDLVHEVYEVNLQKNQLAVRQREIKLKMLASQINPHFLFNALEAIRMRAYCNGDIEVADVIMLLGKIMRKNLEVGNELVLFSDEIDLVKSYLEIQKFRFRNWFNYSLDYSNELSDYKLLPLIIQPVIENAVVHGLKFVEEGGSISLSAEGKCGLVIITIEDNGSGMDEERLKCIINSLDEVEDSIEKHIGLRNVYQRIKLFYGDEYGLTINSKSGDGTKVEITLPGKE